MSFRFADPLFLLLLIPLATLGLRALFRARKPASTGLGLPTLQGSRDLPLGLTTRVAPFLFLIKLGAVALLIVGLARPQSGRERTEIQTRGVNIVLALDLSESMRALDFKRDGEVVDRLQAVKGVVGDFILKRDQDRMGMVVFGSNAFTQVPLTRDYDTLTFILDRLRIGAAGPRTAIGDAVGISLKRLKDIPSDSNIIILLTDGESNAGELNWEEAAAVAAAQDVKIYTIGVGSNGQAPFLVDGLLGKQYVYRRVGMDVASLKAIAQITGGLFFKAEDTQGLEAVYDRINTLEKTEVTQEKWVEYKEQYPKAVVAALVLLLLHLLLTQTRFMRIP